MPLEREKKMSKIGKKRGENQEDSGKRGEKSGKSRKIEERSERKRKHRECSFTLSFLNKNYLHRSASFYLIHGLVLLRLFTRYLKKRDGDNKAIILYNIQVNVSLMQCQLHESLSSFVSLTQCLQVTYFF